MAMVKGERGEELGGKREGEDKRKGREAERGGGRWRGKRGGKGRQVSNAQWRLNLSTGLYKNYFSILQV